MPALLLGSISTVADTSELQREAFNRAFAEHGVGWTWDREEYQRLLTSNGGRDRVAEYADERGEQVDAEAVHRTKSEIFQRSLAEGGLEPRPGVTQTVAAAREAGWRVGLVTTTARENLDALLSGLPGLSAEDFDLVTDVSTVETSKPSPEIYAEAVQRLGEQAGDCVAVEDNVGGVEAADGAGIACLAFPNANTAGHDFAGATVVETLRFDDVRAAAGQER